MTEVAKLSGVRKRLGGAEGGFELIADLSIAAGARIAVVGASGSGKSTLLNIIGLALRPDAAAHFLLRGEDGEDVDVMALWREGAGEALATLRGRHIGYVPQTGGLLPFLSIGDNIALAARLFRRYDAARIRALVESLGIAAYMGRLPAQLSVGQRQRAAVARALAHAPAIVVADEPTASVDPATANDVFKLLLSQIERSGAALVVASHDWDLVHAFSLETVRPEIGTQNETHVSHFRSLPA